MSVLGDKFCIVMDRSDPNKQIPQNVTAREHFVFTDQDGLLYHFIVEGNMIKDGSKIPPDVSVAKNIFNCHLSLKVPRHNYLGNGLFTLPDSDSDSDSKPYHYIVLYRSLHIGSDPDLDPYSNGFPNGYCTHFRDGSPSQGQMSIPILLYFNQGIRVQI